MPNDDIEDISELILRAEHLAERRQLATVVYLLGLAMVEMANERHKAPERDMTTSTVVRGFPRRHR